jgi:hypothetical protein
MILQIATALAIGIYVALSKDVERTTPREPFRHSPFILLIAPIALRPRRNS